MRANNFAVFALKRKASRAQALDDFYKLDEMCRVLNYPLAIFVNIASAQHYSEDYSGPFPEQHRAFGVVLRGGVPRIFGGGAPVLGPR